jgi:eukaryotic-like serine/threonine-protein kinase
MPLIPGQVLDNHYRVVKMLAQGGYGTVYRAWDIQLNGPCALKENLDSGPISRSQFEFEANMLASLSHPNLPKVRDHLVIPEGQFIVMDFIEGEDLQTKLKQSGVALAETQVLNWIYQVCDALTTCITKILQLSIATSNLPTFASPLRKSCACRFWYS